MPDYLAYWHAKRLAVEMGRVFEGMCATDLFARYGEVASFVEVPPEGFRGDDDTTMPLALLLAYEEHGLDATSAQIAASWNRNLPINWFWHFRKRLLLRIAPPRSGQSTEQAGDHVGPMILADLVGVLSDSPEQARHRAIAMGQVCAAGEGVAAGEIVADIAQRISHGQNAASAAREAIAAPWLSPNPGRTPGLVRRISEIDVAEFMHEPRLNTTIPPGSLGKPEPWVHALPNLAAVLRTWLACDSAMEAIYHAIGQGWDTDTTAACAASPLAARDGLGALDPDYDQALGDKLPNPLRGLREITLGEAAQRTAALRP